MSIWEDYEPASFQLDGGPVIRFMLRVVQQGGSARLPSRKRPFRPGEKLDSTGRNAHTWNFTSLFTNDAEEPGVTNDGGLAMYPDRLNQLTDAFDTTKTGTLNLPWARGIRAKCENWTRTEDADAERDAGILNGVFREDNEDTVDRHAIVRMSTRGGILNNVEETVFDAESQAAWTPHMSLLTEYAQALVAVINAPQDVLNDLNAHATRVLRAVSDIRNALSSYDPGRNQFNDPESSRMRLRLLALEDLAAQASWEARRRAAQTRQIFLDERSNIWTIATTFKQSANKLMELNPEIEDFSFIEAGVAVRILAS